MVVPPLGDIDLSPLREGEELAIIKRLLQSPDVVKAAARALEPHRVAYWLQELAGIFHPYYKSHRVIQDDRRLVFGPVRLCPRVGARGRERPRPPGRLGPRAHVGRGRGRRGAAPGR